MFSNSLLACLGSFWRHYFGWGRATRAEYWWGMLFWGGIIPRIVLWLVMSPMLIQAVSQNILLILVRLSLVFLFVLVIPIFCLSVCRWHDTGRSAWIPFLMGLVSVICTRISVYGVYVALVMGIVTLVFMCLPGDKEANKYGEPRI